MSSLLFRQVREVRNQVKEPHYKRGEQIPACECSDRDLLCRTPLVSIVVLTYNHEPYIRRAIESYVHQECKFEYELILGEDASPDKTREICLEMQQKYPNIIRVIYSDQNVGLHRNDHRCLALVRGSYVARCEGDDYWRCDTRLQEQVDFLESHPDVDFIGGECDIIRPDETGKIATWNGTPARAPVRPTLKKYRDAHLSTWMYRSTLIPFFEAYRDKIPLTDAILSMLVVAKGRYVILPRVYSVHVKTGTGMWSHMDVTAATLERIRYLNTCLRCFPKTMQSFLLGQMSCTYHALLLMSWNREHPDLAAAALIVWRMLANSLLHPFSLPYFWKIPLRAIWYRIRS